MKHDFEYETKHCGDRVDVKTPGGIVKMKVLSIRKR